MPLVAICPNDHKVRVLDGCAGKKVRCPVCQAVFVAPAGGMPPQVPEKKQRRPVVDEPEDEAAEESGPTQRPRRPAVEESDEDGPEEPRKKKRRRRKVSRNDYQTVRSGLLLLILQMAVGMLGTVLGVIVGFIAGWSHSELLLAASGWIVLAGAVAGGILGLIGSSMCATVPAESGARGFIVASVVLILLSIGSSILPRMVSLAGIPPLAVACTNSLILAAAWFMLVLFLRQLGYHLGERGYARDAETLLVAGGVVWAGSVAGPFIGLGLVFLGGAGMIVGMIYGLAMLYGSIRYLLFGYLQLLVDFRGVLQGPK
jgi:hypothetical protein